jgi:hypothetical protein
VNPKKFLTELKLRKVYKVAIACVVVAWLLIHVATLHSSLKSPVCSCVSIRLTVAFHTKSLKRLVAWSRCNFVTRLSSHDEEL